MSLPVPLLSFQPLNAQPQIPGCVVEINNNFPSNNMFPGQETELISNVTGQGEIANYTWSIEGPIIKDYDDLISESDYLSSSVTISNYSIMSESDFHNPSVTFYWQPTTDTNRTVTLEVQTSNGNICKDSEDFIVTRSNNSNFQAEDFYADYNHRKFLTEDDNERKNRLLAEHQRWHESENVCCDRNYNGTLFLDFHHILLAHFDAWRMLFGYDNITIWDPNAPIESGAEIDHDNREVDGTPYYPYLNQSLPNWFKIHAENTGPQDRHPINTLGCESSDDLQNSTRDIEDSLGDFPADRDLLGCVITTPFHNGVHRNIGQTADEDGDGINEKLGDMRSSAFAPKDPIFWRFHKFIDEVSLNKTKIDNMIRPIVDQPAVMEDSTSPHIISQNPFRLNPYITTLPIIEDPEKDLFGISGVEALSIEFNEPVLGIKANDLTINGSYASQVNGTGVGPYVFIGFESPGKGPVNVTVSSGNITDISGNNFEGDSWEYILIDEDEDSDLDGAEDSLEAELLFTDPTIPDTDGDTMPDGFEATTTCLDPLESDTHLMDITGEIINNETLDSDEDEVNNLVEFGQGTDPCISDQGPEPTGQERDFVLEGIMPGSPEVGEEPAEPFVLVIEKTKSTPGEVIRLSYDSLTKELSLITNGNETKIGLDSSNETSARRILNSSGFFEAENFYLPTSNITDYDKFTLIALLNGKLNAIHWTTASEDVPEPIENLPFALSAMIGTGRIF